MNTDKENLECTQTDVLLQSVYTSNQETPLGHHSKAKHKHGPEAWLAATPEVTTVEVSESKLQSPELVTVENITVDTVHSLSWLNAVFVDLDLEYL